MYINRNKLNCSKMAGFVFKPGVNQVPDDLKDRLLKDRQFKFELAHGMISFVGAPAGPTAPADPIVAENEAEKFDPLKLSVKNIIPIINDTVSPETLNFWREGEEKGQGRKGVLNAIDDQLEKIAPPPPAAEVTTDKPVNVEVDTGDSHA